MKLLVALILSCAVTVMGVQNGKDYSVFTADGSSATVADIVNGLESTDVLFLGENHDDSVGHRLQLEIFRSIVEKYGDSRSVVLSLEMFDRDVQVVLDEYLQGLITEKHFRDSSRPWGNYETDYRPLVELAKSKGIPVIAANAPRRYVNMVARKGRDSLAKLDQKALGWIAPLPYAEASDAYKQKFEALMAKMGGQGGMANHKPMIDSQSLWDATMAHSISEAMVENENALVVHLNGSFHSEKRLGAPEHLSRYRKGVSFTVVTMRYEKEFGNFDSARHNRLGDYVVLTDSSAPRSKR